MENDTVKSFIYKNWWIL